MPTTYVACGLRWPARKLEQRTHGTHAYMLGRDAGSSFMPIVRSQSLEALAKRWTTEAKQVSSLNQKMMSKTKTDIQMNEPQDYNPLNMVAEVGMMKEPTPRRDINKYEMCAISMITGTGANHRGDREAWTPAKNTPVPVHTPEKPERRGRKTITKTKADAHKKTKEPSRRSRSGHRSPEPGTAEARPSS